MLTLSGMHARSGKNWYFFRTQCCSIDRTQQTIFECRRCVFNTFGVICASHKYCKSRRRNRKKKQITTSKQKPCCGQMQHKCLFCMSDHIKVIGTRSFNNLQTFSVWLALLDCFLFVFISFFFYSFPLRRRKKGANISKMITIPLRMLNLVGFFSLSLFRFTVFTFGVSFFSFFSVPFEL